MSGARIKRRTVNLIAIPFARRVRHVSEAYFRDADDILPVSVLRVLHASVPHRPAEGVLVSSAAGRGSVQRAVARYHDTQLETGTLRGPPLALLEMLDVRFTCGRGARRGEAGRKLAPEEVQRLGVQAHACRRAIRVRRHGTELGKRNEPEIDPLKSRQVPIYFKLYTSNISRRRSVSCNVLIIFDIQNQPLEIDDYRSEPEHLLKLCKRHFTYYYCFSY